MITHGRHGSILNAGHDRYWTFCLPTKLIAKFTFLPPAAAANESLRPELQEYAGDQIIILSHSLAQSDTIRNHSLYRNTNSLTKGFESCQCIRDTLVIFFHTAFLNVYAKICHWVNDRNFKTSTSATSPSSLTSARSQKYLPLLYHRVKAI